MKMKPIMLPGFLYLLIWPPTSGVSEPVYTPPTYEQTRDSLAHKKDLLILENNRKLATLKIQEKTIELSTSTIKKWIEKR